MAVFVASEANDLTREGEVKKAGLEIAKVSAFAVKVPAEVIGEEDAGIPQRPPASARGVHVEITVRNLEESPSFISRLMVTFQASGHPDVCSPAGGPLSVTAEYQVKIPWDQPLQKGSGYHKVPFTVTHELTHEIRPNMYEKFLISLGPEYEYEEMPWLGIFKIALERDSGEKVETNPIAAIEGDYTTRPFSESANDDKERRCQVRNSNEVLSMLKVPDLILSREFRDLKAELEAIRSSN
ncbi:hypothetical protein GCM10010329_86720 [Streptomyces spiroverticillatus]|nr:hypothetical protein GCM10010329_86720 [Streptomyces spiroverticillatus]